MTRARRRMIHRRAKNTAAAPAVGAAAIGKPLRRNRSSFLAASAASTRESFPPVLARYATYRRWLRASSRYASAASAAGSAQPLPDAVAAALPASAQARARSTSVPDAAEWVLAPECSARRSSSSVPLSAPLCALSSCVPASPCAQWFSASLPDAPGAWRRPSWRGLPCVPRRCGVSPFSSLAVSLSCVRRLSTSIPCDDDALECKN